MSTNSSHVDERVVQMEFDNKQFEKNVSQTMTTLDKLKAKLKFDDSAKDFRALERASSGVSFDSLAMSISSLNDRFSTFGIVGMTIMQRLTNAAIDLGKHLLSSVSAPLNQIKTGGWNRALNIENAMFKMGGLLKDFEEQRERIDENINYAVSGTAYSYDAAASAMAQLLASGVEFRGESMDMMNALRAISGVAAMTNSEYSDIAHIFTTVAGNGRLMTEQLNQISNRGIGAAATLAEAFGVTEAELREMVSKGKISFQEFANAMDDAFGEHAKKANETFTGALSNIKAALSRTGQGFATSLQTYGRDILNAIRPNINNLNKKYLQPLVDDFDSIMSYLAAKAKSIFGDGQEGILYLGWVPRAIRTIENVVLGLVGILEQLKKAFSEIFPKKTRDDVLMFWVRIERATDKFRKAFSDTTSVVDKFKSKVEELTKPVTDAAETLEKTVHTVEELQEITKRVISGEFGNGEQRFKALEELGWNWKEVQNSVNETLGCSFRYEDVQESITEESKKQENYLGRMSGRMSLLEEQEERYGKEFVANTREAKRYVSETERARDNRLNNLRSTFRGIAAAIKIVAQAGEALNKVILKPLREKGLPMILDAILAKTARLGEKLVQLSNWLEETKFFEGFFQGLVDIFWILVSAVSATVGKLKELYEWFVNLEIVQFIVGSIGQFFQDLPGNIERTKNKVVEFGTALKNMPGVQKFLETITGLATTIKGFAERKLHNIAEYFKNFSESGNGAIVVGGVLWVINQIADKLNFVINKLQDAYDATVKFLKPYYNSAKNAISQFFGEGGVDIDEFKKKLEESGGIKGILTSFATNVGQLLTDVFNTIPWENIGAIILKGIGLVFIYQVFKVLTGVFLALKSVAGIGDAASGVLKSMSSVLQSYVDRMKVEKLMNVAKAIAIFTGCIVALALLPASGLQQAAAAIVAVSFGISVLLKAIQKLKGPQFEGIVWNIRDYIKMLLSSFVKMAGLVVVAIGVVGSIYLLVRTVRYVIDNLINVDANKMLKTVLVMIAAFAALFVAVGLFISLAEAFRVGERAIDPTSLIGFGAVLIGIGGGLYLVSLAAAKFADVDFTSIAKAGVALAAMMIGVAAMAYATKGANPIQAAAVILALAVAVNALLIPIAVISAMAKSEGGTEGLTWAVKIIGGFLVLSSILMAATHLAKPSAFLAAGTSMMMIASTLIIIAQGLKMFESLKITNETITVLRNTAIAIAVITGIVALLAGLGGFQMSAGLALIGGFFLEISVAALALSAALLVLGMALPTLANGIADFGAILSERSKDIAIGVTAILVAIAAGIVGAKFAMSGAAGTMIEAFTTGLSSGWGSVLSFIKNHGVITIVTLVLVLLAALNAVIPVLVDGIVNAIETLADTLLGRAAEIAYAFTKVVVAVVKILVLAIYDIISPLIKLFGKDLDNEIGKMLDDGFDSIAESIYDGGAKAKEASESTAKDITKAVEENYSPSQVVAEENAAVQQQMAANQPAMAAASASTAAGMTGGFFDNFDMLGAITGPNGLSGVYNTIAQSNPQFAAMMSQYGIGGQTSLESTFTPAKYVSEELDNGIMAVGNAKATGQDAIVTYGTTLNSALRDTVKEGTEETAASTDDWFSEGMAESGYDVSQWSDLNFEGMYSVTKEQAYAAGSETPQEYAQGAIDNVSAVVSAGDEISSTLVETLDGSKTELQSSGSQGGLAFARGIGVMMSRVKSEGTRLKNNAVNGTNGVYDSMYRQGSYAGEGFYDGMGSWADAIADRAYKIVKGAVQAAKDAEDSNSPSKETRKLGVYFDQGFILGMQDLSGNVSNAASNVATDALDAMRTAVGKIGAILSTDLDYEPTIRPVMDLSDVEAGAKLINDAIAKSGAFIPVGAVGSTARLAGQFAASDSKLPGSDGINAGNSYVFTQNNYSPKALSRLEIYRQTKNQFAQMKGLTANG